MNYFPELDYYFLNYWKDEGEITIDHIFLPEVSDSYAPTPGSIIQVLFDNNYSSINPPRYFMQIISTSLLPKPTRERIYSSRSGTVCYVSAGIDDEGSQNIFGFSSTTINMLSLLTNYRLGSNPDLSLIDYETLDQTLGRMVYNYLDLVINFNFDNINSAIPDSSSSNLLESLFEIYLTNESHKLIKSWEFLIDSGVVSLRPWRQKNLVTEDILTDSSINLIYTPYSIDGLFIHVNGIDIDISQFTINTDDPDAPLLTWDPINTTFYENDIIITDYYVDTGNRTWEIDLDQEAIYVPSVDEVTIDQIANLNELIAAHPDVILNNADAHTESHTVDTHSDTNATGSELDELVSGDLTDEHTHIPEDIEGGTI